jgi:SecD/SecF fusion protein
MKTIIKSFIAILICGFVLMGYTNRTNVNNTILIQSVNKTVSAISLKQSVVIISNRLKALSSEKFVVTTIPGKNQIKVVLGDQHDLNTIEPLLINKGKLEFYATYNHQRLSELLNDDNHLFSLLHAENASKTVTWVGYSSIADSNKIDDYLKNVKQNGKVKFAWGLPENDNGVCLYALQLEGRKGASFTRADIESANSKQESSKLFSIGMKFKKPAIALWADFTKRNIDNAIAIVLDDNVICAPVVRSEIDYGNCSITGGFTESQAKNIAIIINNGELPVSFKVVK